MIVFVLTLSASEDKEKIKCKVCVLQLIDARPSLGSHTGYLSFEHAHSSSNGSMRLLSLNRPLSDCHFYGINIVFYQLLVEKTLEHLL